MNDPNRRAIIRFAENALQRARGAGGQAYQAGQYIAGAQRLIGAAQQGWAMVKGAKRYYDSFGNRTAADKLDKDRLSLTRKMKRDAQPVFAPPKGGPSVYITLPGDEGCLSRELKERRLISEISLSTEQRDSGTSVAFGNLNIMPAQQIQPGTGSDDRVGRGVMVLNTDFRVSLFVSNSNQVERANHGSFRVRMILLVDSQVNNSIPQIEDILGDDWASIARKPDIIFPSTAHERFTILYDKTRTIRAMVGSNHQGEIEQQAWCSWGHAAFEFSSDLMVPITYRDTDLPPEPPNEFTRMTSNGFFWLMLWDDPDFIVSPSVGSTWPAFSYTANFKQNYVDL